MAFPRVGSHEGSGEECPSEAAPELFIRKRPNNPVKAGRGRHEATHLPYRSWCEDCVTGRSRRDPRTGMGKTGVPVLSFDYCFLSKEQSDQEAEALPILVITDSWSSYLWAFMVPKKGADIYALDCFLRAIDETG